MDSGGSGGIVDRLLANGTFIGGPPELFDIAGDCQLGILRHFGMGSESKVLDIGCGCLRGGRKVIPELNPGCYFGIEPNKEMLEAGRQEEALSLDEYLELLGSSDAKVRIDAIKHLAEFDAPEALAALRQAAETDEDSLEAESGGAVATACEKIAERAASIAAHLMQVSTEEVQFENGEIVGPTSSMSLEEVAQIWYLKPQLLPPAIDSGGLEVTVGYKPKTDSGTFSYASHEVVVAVDPELGDVEILDYVIIEDGGTLINPMVVEGQVYGGAGQGIGTALYEEMPFDAAGQPLASTLADYLLPGPTEMPHFRVFHMETPSPNTKFGIKGIGEGGAIAPPAAIGNAINDALASLGVELCESPMSPRRILAAIAEAPPREGA